MSSAAKLGSVADVESQKRQFAHWAHVYDELPNPLLALEERFLSPLLTSVRGKDVLDIGCGTGRWLKLLETRSPGSLTGIDSSPDMLERAGRKLAGKAMFAIGDATTLPVPSSSADFVIASFVASYVSDLQAWARELRRVARPKARLYVSDMHPETAAACHWKRGFRNAHGQARPATCARTLSDTLAILREAGFRIACVLEPPFGLPELGLFRSSGKLDAFEAAEGLPAIYIAELYVADSHYVAQAPQACPPISLHGARIALDSDTAVTTDVNLNDGRIASIAAHDRLNGGSDALQLQRYMLLPGLINAHDHLEFGLYPRLGCGPYRNAAEWARDIQQRDRATISAHQSISREARLWWGAIRNLLCGVTTVSHHNALHPELLNDDFPVDVIRNFGWAHSRAWDTQLEQKARSTPPETPFVLHACEGTDDEASSEIFELDHLNAVNGRTVLVHGLGLDQAGIALLNTRGAAMAWCPTSNRFLFGRTHTCEAIRAVDRVLLGSDSPLTADGDLLDEVRYARDIEGISPRELYRMIFERPPAAFRLNGGEGRIRPGATASVIAVRDLGLSPAEALAGLKTSDIELVMVRGRVQLTSDDIYRRLPPNISQGLFPIEVNRNLRWIRAPLAKLFREAERVLGREIKLGGKRVRHVCSAWL